MFYRDLDGRRVYTVAVNGDSYSEPRLLFEGDYELYFEINYDVAPDGETYLMVRRIVSPSFDVVVNWFGELEQLVPTGN